MKVDTILVCGGRDYADAEKLDIVLSGLMKTCQFRTIIEGGANGADAIARKWAKDNGIECKTYQADWKRHGKAAGPIRNQLMIDEGHPDLCVAFPGGSGTENMLGKCAIAGVSIMVISKGGLLLRLWKRWEDQV
jgi:hypothetical protein